MTVREYFLTAATTAVELLASSAVGDRWSEPSALEAMRVSGLAGHLALQVFYVPYVLDAEPPTGLTTVSEHYAAADWVGTPIDDESNVETRQAGEETAASGQERLVIGLRSALEGLRSRLDDEPADRAVRLPWADDGMLLDDFLLTRLLEITVHTDDLAVSVDLPPPNLSADALLPVLTALTEIAVRRHGGTAVLRALSRSERAPSTVSAL